jgi:hypothetical protein
MEKANKEPSPQSEKYHLVSRVSEITMGIRA